MSTSRIGERILVSSHGDRWIATIASTIPTWQRQSLEIWFGAWMGLGAMLAYGRRYEREGFFPAAVHVLRRAWILYVAHVFLLAQLMVVVFVANDNVETRDFIAEMGLRYFLDQPQEALLAGILMQFKPVLMDPLPLYVVLMTLMALGFALITVLLWSPFAAILKQLEG